MSRVLCPGRSISLVSQPSSGSSTYLGLTVTNFNQFGTWPLLQVRLGQALVAVLMLVMPQLPGLTGATAVTIAVTMIAGYYGAALLLASDTTNRSRQLCAGRGRPAADDDCAQDPRSCGGGQASCGSCGPGGGSSRGPAASRSPPRRRVCWHKWTALWRRLTRSGAGSGTSMARAR